MSRSGPSGPRAYEARSGASNTKSVRAEVDTFQPTMRRANTSMMKAALKRRTFFAARTTLLTKGASAPRSGFRHPEDTGADTVKPGARAVPDTVTSSLIPSDPEEAPSAIPSGPSNDRLFGRKLAALDGLEGPQRLARRKGTAGLVEIPQQWTNMNLDEISWMNGAKARQSVGIGAGTRHPVSGRRLGHARASMLQLTIEWE